MKKSSLDLNLSNKNILKRVFFFEMDRVVPWAALVKLIALYYPEAGRRCFADHGACAFHAAMGRPVRPGHGRGLL